LVVRSRVAKTLLVFLTALAGCRGSSGPVPSPGRVAGEGSDGASAAAVEQADSLLREAAERGFGGAVVVERHGKVLLERGYGWANREKQVPFTKDTVAQIGSLTKQFTAAAIVALWNDGKLDLHAPLARYLPEAPSPARDRTLHQLLTHTAGAPEYCGPDFVRRTAKEFLLVCLAADRMNDVGPPSYSNVGYSALGLVVEAVSGVSLESYLERRLLAPLGLERTGYRFPDLDPSRMAHGYGGGGMQLPISQRLAELEGDAWNLYGNGGMQASASDMARWHRALRSGGDVVTAGMRDALFTPHVHRDGEVYVGYGWFLRIRPDDSVRRISHSGSDGIFFAYAMWEPDAELFFYFVGNNGEAAVLETLRAVRAAFTS
jgi:CubicO group peptidase (beta-lactamase class C family)